MSGARSAAKNSRVAYVGLLIGLLLLAIGVVGPDDAVGAPAKAGECLSGPKEAAPQGERWYYRVDRSTKRNCWYTRAATSRKIAQPVPEEMQSAKAPEASAPEPLQSSVANARAEADLTAASVASSVTNDTAPAAETQSRTWTLAERWVDRPQASAPAPQSQPHEPPGSQPLPQPKPQAQPTVAMMRTVVQNPAESPAKAEDAPRFNWLEMIGGGLAAVGFATVMMAMLVRRRKERGDQDAEIGAMSSDPSGKAPTTWYEPPIDRLRMARHIAELPRPAA